MFDTSKNCSQHPAHKSLCSEHLMYFVNEYHVEDYPEDKELPASLDRFLEKCIAGPLSDLSVHIESPTFAHEVEKMISSYNWYITNRFWAFQLLYPLVSFLRIYYSIILTSCNVQLYEDILRTYVDSLDGEAM
ncbi:hypothetical protein [Thiolapillus sp.]|uniref:hypothetical protein n=1 Tax=Thiolapillus sp. TaxID=2017437 RepID=UPI003AF93FB2